MGLYTPIKDDDPDFRVKLTTWSALADEMLSELLSLMGKNLGYDFDKVRIKKGIYTPRGHGDFELENSIIRRGMVEIMSGKRGFPVSPFEQFKDRQEQQ